MKVILLLSAEFCVIIINNCYIHNVVSFLVSPTSSESIKMQQIAGDPVPDQKVDTQSKRLHVSEAIYKSVA